MTFCSPCSAHISFSEHISFSASRRRGFDSCRSRSLDFFRLFHSYEQKRLLLGYLLSREKGKGKGNSAAMNVHSSNFPFTLSRAHVSFSEMKTCLQCGVATWDMTKHVFVHLADEMKLFRYICLYDECQAPGSAHRDHVKWHTILDHGVCGKYIFLSKVGIVSREVAESFRFMEKS